MSKFVSVRTNNIFHNLSLGTTSTMMAYCNKKMSEWFSVMCRLSTKRTNWGMVHRRSARQSDRGKASTIAPEPTFSNVNTIKMRLITSQTTYLAIARLYPSKITRRLIKMWRQRCSQASCASSMKCCHAHVTSSAWSATTDRRSWLVTMPVIFSRRSKR